MKTTDKITNAKMKDFLKEKLTKSEVWQISGLLTIYNNQTQDEQITGNATYYNEIGFTGVDAEILTSFSKQVLRNTTKCRWCGEYQDGHYQCKKCRRPLKPLSYKQMLIIIKKMPKYWKQIWESAKLKDGGEALKKAYWKEHPQTDLFK